MPRSITITGAPFDVRLSSVSTMHFSENGAFTVKDEVADKILAAGNGYEGKAPGAKSKNGKGGPARRRARGSAKTSSTTSGKGATKQQIAANAKGDAAASSSQPDSGVDGASVAADDSASTRNG